MAGRRRSLVALALLGSIILAGCADQITTGPRPNRPASGEVQPPVVDPAPVDPSQLPGYQAGQPNDSGWLEKPMTGMSGKVSWKVYDPNQTPINWGGEPYAKIPGVLTFRGDPTRTSPTYGTADIKDRKLQIVWTHDIGEVSAEGSHFPGAGWTGQPLLVQWPKETKQAMDLPQEMIDDDNFVEVVYPVFDGNIYRLRLADGAQTKPPISVGFGFKGTGTIDPRGYPLLYSGQGLHENNGKTGTWEYRIFDLIQNKQISAIPGKDPVSKRKDPEGWGAFDSSALVDAKTDTLIEPGENGVVYKAKLNVNFDPGAKTVSVNPELAKMTYETPLKKQGGIESSAVGWRNLMYATDNDGDLICWDATTLDVVWAAPNFDNADATMALDATPEGPFLYVGNSIGWRGFDRLDMVTNLRKVNGLTGKVEWSFDVPAYFNWHVKGGLLSSALLGKGEASDLVVFSVSKTSSPSEGNLIALDKKTGKVVWNRSLAKYSWSSPVSITGSDGHQYGAFGDSAGTVHLFDMNTGEDYATVDLGANVEASISAFGNMLVVASYDKKIFGIKVS